MNNVHGIAVDPQTARCSSTIGRNHRAQVFDENGKFFVSGASDRRRGHSFCSSSGADVSLGCRPRHVQDAEVRPERHFMYSGAPGEIFPAHVGVHGLSTDQEGNFYTAEVDSGRAQKYRPRPGANPAFW